MPAERRYRRSNRGSNDPVVRYLGDKQATVMAILWKRGSGTVREVLDDMPAAVAYTTVMTMMVRLYERDLLTRQHEGRGYRYRPRKSRDEFVSDLAGSLLGRLVDDFGDAALARIVEAADELDPSRASALRRRVTDA
jgi:predicted transcriptional regulator